MREPQRIGEFMWQAMPEGNEKRQAYYCSREWSVKKEAVKSRSGGTCERCGLYPGQNVHHKTYHRLYSESLEELWHLCIGCHEFIHGHSDSDPAKEEEAKPGSLTDINKMLILDGSEWCQWEKGMTSVRCPVCSYQNCHCTGGGMVDGCEVVVTFWGECNHAWDVVFVTDKGFSFAFIRNIRDKEQ